MTIPKWKVGALFVVIAVLLTLFYFGSHFTSVLPIAQVMSQIKELDLSTSANLSFNAFDKFNVEEDDVFVFLHMQKTGGTFFGKSLVKNLLIDPPCKCSPHVKRCNCKTKNRKNWLFSRYSTGWKCGLHADWTELQSCVNDKLDEMEGGHRKRRLHYITYLRDPIRRYISEWKHVRRGATWKAASLKCNGKDASLTEVPFCFNDSDWAGVTLDDFLDCPHNLANNRQTRMLADLRLVNCYNTTSMSEETRNKIMLKSAIQNLQNTSFFGLSDYQHYSQILFEKTFHLSFLEDFEQKNTTKAGDFIIAPYLQRVTDKNLLDIQLYKFAKKLFFKRLKTVIPSFKLFQARR